MQAEYLAMMGWKWTGNGWTHSLTFVDESGRILGGHGELISTASAWGLQMAREGKPDHLGEMASAALKEAGEM